MQIIKSSRFFSGMWAVILLASLVLGFWSNAVRAIDVADSWVRGVPPTSKNTAVYFTLKNHSDKTQHLFKVSSKVADVLEIHEVFNDNGLMGMRPVESVEIPSRGRVEFKPAGFHIMMIGLKRPLPVGDKVAMDLHLSDGSIHSITAEVRLTNAVEANESANDHHHDHHHH